MRILTMMMLAASAFATQTEAAQAAVAHASQTSPTDTVRVADFGAVADSYTNATPAIARAIAHAKATGAKVLLFGPGRYDVWTEGATRKTIYVSNTSSQEETADKTKILGIHFDGVSNLTVDGAGATLMMHGQMTPIAIDRCTDITLKDLTVDFERPGGSELTIVSSDSTGTVVRLHSDSRYDISPSGRFSLIGEGWRSNVIHCIRFDPATQHMTYSTDWSVLEKSPATELAPGLVKFATPAGFSPLVGSILTVRDRIRHQTGMLLLESRGVTFQDINVRYMHGLGIVSQYSRNITMLRVNCTPDSASGRILASSADFMHFSGCSGHIEIRDCNYSGSQDDAINVHGTNLRIAAVTAPSTVRMQFMHPQTYGFAAYHPGDTVAYVNPATMLRTDTAVVRSVVMDPDPHFLELTLDRLVPPGVSVNSTCLENLTCTPSLHVSGCRFTRLSTRGILATTPRKVVIENNLFERLGMSGVLIEGDAAGWFESGPVTDVTIRGNTFIDCGYAGSGSASITINPSTTSVSAAEPVHENVVITGNTFDTDGRLILQAKSTAGLVFTDNKILGPLPRPAF